MGIALVLQILLRWSEAERVILNMLMTGTIAALTIGGKAAGKRLALTHPNEVIFLVGRIIAAWNRLSGMSVGKKEKRRSRD